MEMVRPALIAVFCAGVLALGCGGSKNSGVFGDWIGKDDSGRNVEANLSKSGNRVLLRLEGEVIDCKEEGPDKLYCDGRFPDGSPRSILVLLRNGKLAIDDGLMSLDMTRR